MQNKTVAIIIARGGSKRIPRKNIKEFLGKPIIAYSIEAALHSNLFDEVMVSTDDAEIAAIAKQFGAKIPFIRSEKNADDFATTVDVLVEVLNDYQKIDTTIDYACCLYPTAPFVSADLLQKAYQKLIENQFDTVFPALAFSFPIQRAIRLNEQQQIRLFQPEYMATRSQDLEKAYHDAGQFYWFKTSAIIEQKKLWTDNTGIIVLDEMQAQDIDTIEDWKIAEFKYKLLQHEKA